MDVIVCQVQEVAGDASVDSLRVSPVLEVVVVHEDDDWVGAPDEEVPPVFETSNNGQKFSVVDVIVSFSGVECLGVVSYRPLLPCSFMFLVQYCSGGEC